MAGTERWWWPLRQHPYLALNNLSLQWRVRRDERGTPPAYERLLAETGIEYILLNRNVYGDLAREPLALQEAFWAFIATCTTVAAEWDDPWYGEISLHAVGEDCRSSSSRLQTAFRQAHRRCGRTD